MKTKFELALAVAVIVIVFIVIIYQPVPDSRIEEYERRERESKERLQVIMNKFDSLERYNETLADGYKRLYHSLELSERERKILEVKYERLKNRAYYDYPDSTVLRILTERYGVDAEIPR